MQTAGSLLTVNGGARIRGDGVITGNVNVLSGGTTTVGWATGGRELRITGNYTNQSGSVLNSDTLSTGIGSNAVLHVSSNLHLGNSVVIQAATNGAGYGGFLQSTQATNQFSGLSLGGTNLTFGAGATATWSFLNAGQSWFIDDPFIGGVRLTATTTNALQGLVDSGRIVTGGVADLTGYFFFTVTNSDGYAYLALGRQSDDKIWSGGGGDNNWTTGANWLGGNSPTNGGMARVIFATAPNARTNSVVDTPWDIRSLVFSNSVTTNYHLTGSALTLRGGLSGIGITNDSAFTQTINNNIEVAPSDGTVQNWYAASGDIHLGGTVNVSNNTLNLLGAQDFEFMSGSKLLLSNGVLHAAAGGVRINGSDVIHSIGGASTVTGNYQLASDSGVRVDAGTLTVSNGGFNGAHELTKTGAGALVMSGSTNAGLSGLNVAAGTLTVTNASRQVVTNTTVGEGANLALLQVGGTGTIYSNTANITIGDAGNSNRLVVSGGALLWNGGNIDVGVNGGLSNTLQVTGTGTVLSNTSGGINLYGGVSSRNRRVISAGATVYNSTTNNAIDTIDGGNLVSDGYVLGNLNEALTEVHNGGELVVTNSAGDAVLDVINGTLDAVDSTVQADIVQALTADGVINVDNSIFQADSILISNAMMNVINGSQLAGNLVVEDSATFNVASGVAHTGDVTLNSGSSIAVSNGLFSVSGTLTFNTDMTFDYTAAGQFEIDDLIIAGANTVTWNFDATPLYGDWLMRSTNDIFEVYLTGNQILANNLSGPFTLQSFYSGSFYYLAVIPEPSTYALMILGGFVMFVAVRRARKKQAASV